jgi:beta-glucanase (GH16 family)
VRLSTGRNKENAMRKMHAVMALAVVAVLGVAVLMAAGADPVASEKAVAAAASSPAKTASAAGSSTGSAAALPGWKLVWSDEFDTPGLVDTTKWTYEEGYIRNNEKQFYTKARKENCRIEGGNLIIEGIKEKFDIPAGKGKGKTVADYTAASIHTAGKFSWQYGRMEMRAKIPQGKGSWPAFWTLGNKGGWPACGEIDIMEFVGKDPDKIHATVHWDAGGHKSKGGTVTQKEPWADFHVYAVDWFADRMDFYLDKNKYTSVKIADTESNGQSSFRTPHYIKLNLAIGGDWGGAIDDSMLPMKYIIDYVRVYEATTAK